MDRKRIGIVGGGQLGRMLAQAGRELGLSVIVLDPTPMSPAGQVADRQIVGDFKDPAAIRELAGEVDALTFEIESADAATLEELARSGMRVYPSPATLKVIKDKLAQKSFFWKRGIAVADFRKVDDAEDAAAVGDEFGYPFLLKARFDAYDGRGNFVVRQPEDIPAALLKFAGREVYAERFVPFVKELALVVARDDSCGTFAYPVVETIHMNNICHVVLAPAEVEEDIRERAQELGRRVMDELEGVGVFGIEMFLLPGGEVLVNEVAPRVHNSGHYTIEACNVSQFTQHMLAVAGLPLERPVLRSPAAMINILGERSGPAEPAGVAEANAVPGVSVHLYGKVETRPERKMGHLTAVAESVPLALERATAARKKISI